MTARDIDNIINNYKLCKYPDAHMKTLQSIFKKIPKKEVKQIVDNNIHMSALQIQTLLIIREVA